MLETEKAGLVERVYDLERQVLEHKDEIVCLKSTLADVLRRLATIDNSYENSTSGSGRGGTGTPAAVGAGGGSGGHHTVSDNVSASGQNSLSSKSFRFSRNTLTRRRCTVGYF